MSEVLWIAWDCTTPNNLMGELWCMFTVETGLYLWITATAKKYVILKHV